jgi:hypothetical protein
MFKIMTLLLLSLLFIACGTVDEGDEKSPQTTQPDTSNTQNPNNDTDTPSTQEPDNETHDETPDETTQTPDTETPDSETPDSETPDSAQNEAILFVDEDDFTFASALNTTTQTTQITVHNSGLANLELTQISLDNRTDFALTHDCPSSLIRNRACTLDISAIPSQHTGTLSGDITIVSSDKRGSFIIHLKAVRIAPVAFLESSVAHDDELNFGTLIVGDSRTKTVTLTNTGTAPLTLNTPNLSPTNTTPFSVDTTQSSCDDTLEINKSCEFIIKATALHNGRASQQFSLLNTSENINTLTMTLKSYGISPILSSLTLYDFQESINTETTEHNITLTNTGTSDLNITNITLDNTNDYTVLHTSCSQKVAPSKSCLVTITTNDTTHLGERNATITILNDSNNSNHLISLTSTRLTALEAQISVIPQNRSILHFGDILLDKTEHKEVVIKNIGTLDLSLEINSSNNAYLINNSLTTCTNTVAPKSECIVTIDTASTASGFKQGILHILSGDSDTPEINLTLKSYAFINDLNLTQTEIDSIKKTTTKIKIALVNDINVTNIADIIHAYLSDDLNDTTTGALYHKNRAYEHYISHHSTSISQDHFNQYYFENFYMPTLNLALHPFEKISSFPNRSYAVKTEIKKQVQAHVFNKMTLAITYLTTQNQYHTNTNLLFNQDGGLNRKLTYLIENNDTIATLLTNVRENDPLFTSNNIDQDLLDAISNSMRRNNSVSKNMAKLYSNNSQLLDINNSQSKFTNLLFTPSANKNLEYQLIGLFGNSVSTKTFTTTLLTLNPTKRAILLDAIFLGKIGENNNSAQGVLNISAMTHGIQSGLKNEGLLAYQEALIDFSKVVQLANYPLYSKLFTTTAIAYLTDTNEATADFITLLETSMFNSDIQ